MREKKASETGEMSEREGAPATTNAAQATSEGEW